MCAAVAASAGGRKGLGGYRAPRASGSEAAGPRGGDHPPLPLQGLLRPLHTEHGCRPRWLSSPRSSSQPGLLGTRFPHSPARAQAWAPSLKNPETRPYSSPPRLPPKPAESLHPSRQGPAMPGQFPSKDADGCCLPSEQAPLSLLSSTSRPSPTVQNSALLQVPGSRTAKEKTHQHRNGESALTVPTI